jgi:DNA-binding NarL/FixJ family response regulator
MAVAADAELVGRETELARLRDFLAGLSEGSRAFVVRGEPGIGKSALWRATVRAAAADGFVVKSARCVEAELPLALVGFGDLLGGAVPAAGDELADHDRAALAAAVGLEAPTERPQDATALPRAFLALLRLLAQDERVLLAIDDLQWLDPASASVLSFAARRLGDARIGVLVTHRDEGRLPVDLVEAFDDGRREELRLGPLSLGALTHLVRSRFGVRITRPALARIHEASGGNPMYGLEFARSLSEADWPQLGPMPVPPSLRDLVRARVERYPRHVRGLLALVAACERPAPTILAKVDPSAASSLETAVNDGAVTIDDDGLVRFTHPLLASAAYGELSLGQQRAVHRKLAEASENVEERARHLTLGSVGPDPAIGSLLDEAAERARARGAPDSAVELAQEAIRVTPAADRVDRDERRLALARYLFHAGRHADAAACIDALLASGASGPLRAQALLLCLPVEHDVDVIAWKLEEALEHTGKDRHLRAQVLLSLSVILVARDELEAGESLAREAAELAEESGDQALQATALLAVARRAGVAGRPDAALLEPALALAERHGTLPGWPTPRRVTAVEVMLWEGDLRHARELLEAELEAVLREGREHDRAPVLIVLTEAEWHAGRWERAERYLEDLDELVEYGDQSAEKYLLLARGRLAAARGLVDDARRLLAESSARSQALHSPALSPSWALGSLALSLDDPAAAWEALEGIERAPAHGTFHLERLVAFADAIEALIALDRLERAEGLLSALEHPFLTRHLWATRAAQRCRALLLLARGDAMAAVASAERAADGFEAGGFPLDHARALLVAGEALRRAGERRRAGEKLDAAKTIFDRLGAAVWADRAAKELRRARPRPRRDRDLTNAERRVATLVAAGKKNREVAAQLFTTVATVEAHLTRIYRKLGIRSRADLARLVADGTLSLDDP